MEMIENWLLAGQCSRQRGKGKKPVKVAPRVTYKMAQLLLDTLSNEILIQSASDFHHQTTKLNAHAECVSDQKGFPHTAPHLVCTCGFFAYDDLTEAQAKRKGKDNVLLTILASGKTFFYDKGYRYSDQQITDVQVGTCSECELPAQSFSLGKPQSGTTLSSLTPVCEVHKRNLPEKNILPLKRLAELASPTIVRPLDNSSIRAKTTHPKNPFRKLSSY